MTESEKKYLSDILHSANLIFTFTSDISSFSEYQADIKTKSAVERHLAIIGEAVNKFSKVSSGGELLNGKQIISLRNRLVHSYDNIDDTIIWAVIVRYLPPLKEEVEILLTS